MKRLGYVKPPEIQTANLLNIGSFIRLFMETSPSFRPHALNRMRRHTHLPINEQNAVQITVSMNHIKGDEQRSMDRFCARNQSSSAL